MRLFYLIVCLLIVHGSVFSQTTSVHFDKPYYFAGEYVFYTLCNDALVGDTIAAKVELEGASHILEPYFLSIADGCAEGYVKLDYAISTGVYPLKIVVFAQDGFKEQVLANPLVHVYNDEDAEVAGESGMQASVEHSHGIEFIPDTYETGQEINCTITLPPMFGEDIHRVSVSVRDQGLFADHMTTIHEESEDISAEKRLQGIPFFGSREVVTPGKIQNHLLFAFNAQDMVFDGTGVDLNTEEFNLELTPFTDKREIIFLDYLDRDISISERAESVKPRLALSHPLMDPAIAQHLQIHREEKQINRMFTQVSLLVSPDSLVQQSSVPAPVHLIDVQNYDVRGTSVDLLKEILLSLKFRRTAKDEYRARMMYLRNGITKLFTRPPLFLVNNLGTRDGNYIAHLPLQDIGYFKIYSDYEVLEDLSTMAFGGMVYVDMLDPNFDLPSELALPSKILQGMQVPLQYPVSLKPRQQAPAVSGLLFWHPHLKHRDGQVQLRFHAADVATDYLVEVAIHRRESDGVEVVRKLLRVR